MAFGRVGFSPSVRNWVWTRSDVIGLSYLVKHLYDRQQTQLQIKVAPEEGETIPAKKISLEQKRVRSESVFQSCLSHLVPS